MQKTYLTRSQSRACSLDHPVGDPYGGPAYGERNAQVVAALPVISQVLGIVGAVKSLTTSAPSAPAPIAPVAPATPAPTTAAPKPVMPTMDQGLIAAQQQKVVAQKTATAGRQSTILSSGASDKLGG